MLLVLLSGPAPAQDTAEEDVPPPLDADIGCSKFIPSSELPAASRWGASWDVDPGGVLLPSVSIAPRGPADLSVETRVFIAGQSPIVSTAGPFSAPTEGSLPHALSLPAEIDGRLAQVSLHVTSTHLETGNVLGRSVVRAFAYRDELGVVHLVREEEARTLTGAGVVRDGYADDTLVGREVAL